MNLLLKHRVILIGFICVGAISIIFIMKSLPHAAGKRHVAKQEQLPRKMTENSRERAQTSSPDSRARNPQVNNGATTAPSPHETVILSYPEKPELNGEMAEATVSAGGKNYVLQPNQIGNFQRVYVEPGAIVPVKVTYPEGEAGEKLIIQAEDGGRLDSGKPVNVDELDQNKSLTFKFLLTNQIGVHRVTLRKGADVKTLDFWVGPPLPVAQAR
jgi:hypothetical protein